MGKLFESLINFSGGRPERENRLKFEYLVTNSTALYSISRDQVSDVVNVSSGACISTPHTLTSALSPRIFGFSSFYF